MPNFNNPAGRLYQLFADYRSRAEEGTTIWDTWALVFEVDPRDATALMPLMGEMAKLVVEIDTIVDLLDDPNLTGLRDTFRSQWASAVWTLERDWRAVPSPGPTLVDQGAFAALGAMSAILSDRSPEGNVPELEARGELNSEIREVIEGLIEEATLPPHLKSVMIQRLHDLSWAIDEVYLGGPGAVEAVMQRLMGQIVLANMSDHETRTNPMVRRVMALAAKVYGAFLLAPQAEKALESWEHMVQALPPGK